MQRLLGLDERGDPGVDARLERTGAPRAARAGVVGGDSRRRGGGEAAGVAGGAEVVGQPFGLAALHDGEGGEPDEDGQDGGGADEEAGAPSSGPSKPLLLALPLDAGVSLGVVAGEARRRGTRARRR